MFNNAAGSAWKALQAEFKTIDSFIEPKKIPTKLEALGYVFKSDGILVFFFLISVYLSFFIWIYFPKVFVMSCKNSTDHFKKKNAELNVDRIPLKPCTVQNIQNTHKT